MWYSDVVIELFQSEFNSSQRSDRYVDKSLLALHFFFFKFWHWQAAVFPNNYVKYFL